MPRNKQDAKPANEFAEKALTHKEAARSLHQELDALGTAVKERYAVEGRRYGVGGEEVGGTRWAVGGRRKASGDRR